MLRALDELGAAAFGEGEGIVRLQASRDGRGALHLTGVPRALEEPAGPWTAIRAPLRHPGPVVAGGYKLSNRLVMTLALDAARAAGAAEALLFDGDERLVEGARSNLLVADRQGRLLTPPAARGSVHGIGLQLARERLPEIAERDLSAVELATAREIVAVNAVRTVAITELDARPVGEGRPGPWAARVADALARD